MRVNVPITVAVDVGTPTTCVPDALAALKSQRMRLAEVALVGPLMVWGGVKSGGFGGAVLAVLGLATMASSARDYARIRDLAAPPPPTPSPAPAAQ